MLLLVLEAICPILGTKLKSSWYPQLNFMTSVELFCNENVILFSSVIMQSPKLILSSYSRGRFSNKTSSKYASPWILNLIVSNWFRRVVALISHCLFPTYLGENWILKVAYVFGFKDIEELSMNLKLSEGERSNFAVAGMLPSFFKLICWLFIFPTLVLGNFNKIVLSSKYSFGCSTLNVGSAPSPFRSNVNLCVFGYCSPF